jgi:hypothetical protein
MPETAWYFYRLNDCNVFGQFCVANAKDPHQYVETRAPDGTVQRWEKRWVGDLLIFFPPDGYSGGPIGWAYDRTIQIGKPMPDDELERQALRCRVSG